jgi:hypothetical protein
MVSYFVQIADCEAVLCDHTTLLNYLYFLKSKYSQHPLLWVYLRDAVLRFKEVKKENYTEHLAES